MRFTTFAVSDIQHEGCLAAYFLLELYFSWY